MRQRTHSGGYDEQCRITAQLVRGLVEECGVAVDDPLGDRLVAGPRGVLHQESVRPSELSAARWAASATVSSYVSGSTSTSAPSLRTSSMASAGTTLGMSTSAGSSR